MEVQLNDVEVMLCRHVAEQRYANNRAAGVPDAQVGKQAASVTDLEGFAAELAFCKAFNVYPDLTIAVRSAERGGDTKFDATLSGCTIDVKATVYPHGCLVAVPWKLPNVAPDYYALMIGRCPSYTFKGFMRGIELLRPERLGTLGHGPTYIARQDELVRYLPEAI